MGKVRLFFSLLILLGTELPRVQAAPEWHLLRAPAFTVLSQLSEGETRAWADRLNQFVAAMHEAMPVNDSLRLPLTVVLFNSQAPFEPYRLYNADGQMMKENGFFRLLPACSTLAQVGYVVNDDTQRAIFWGGTWWYMGPYEARYPLCLSVGLAEVFSTFNIEDGMARWGDPINRHLFILKQRARLPLGRLLAVTRNDPEYYGEMNIRVFKAESWALVHYLLFGVHEGPRSALTDYMAALHARQKPADAFHRAFGVDYAAMDSRLSDYLFNGSFNIAKQPLAPVTGAPAAFVPAPPLSVEVALGRLAMDKNHLALARQHAEAAVQLAPTAPEGYELRASVDALEKKPEQVRQDAQKAVELGSRDAWTLTLLGFQEWQAAGLRGGPTPAEAREIANLYENAINLCPALRVAYVDLAQVLNRLPPPVDKDREFVDVGRRFFPDVEPAGAR